MSLSQGAHCVTSFAAAAPVHVAHETETFFFPLLGGCGMLSSLVSKDLTSPIKGKGSILPVLREQDTFGSSAFSPFTHVSLLGLLRGHTEEPIFLTWGRTGMASPWRKLL